MSQDWLLEQGDRDIPPVEHARGAQWLLGGQNVFGQVWYRGPLDGLFGHGSAEAARQCKHDLGYTDKAVLPTFGPLLRDYLRGDRKQSVVMLARARSRAAKFIWPTVPRGTLIGTPGVGTHSFIEPPNNWESDNAWDISVPLGSKVLAIADGEIGQQFGPLPDPDPRFHGIRLHLVTLDNEGYYAHLSATFPGVQPGKRVKQGDILGASGQARGVPHLHIALKRLVDIKTFR